MFNTFQNNLGITLSEKQKRVVDCVLSKKNVFFTGAAGTGKSVLLQYIINLLKSKYSNYDIGVTASTGIAAINIGGCTLHSFLGLGLATENINILREKIKKLKRVRNRWINTKVLIIDEISMIDSIFFDKVEAIAKFARYSKEPFGGIQVIATGDFYQLPPVSNNKFCFESKSWRLVFNEMIELTDIYRQKDYKFKKILNEIRYGEISQETEMEIRNLERNIICPPGITPTYLFPLREEVQNENEKRLAQLNGKLYTFHSVDTGDKTLLKQIDKNCPALEVINLKVGAQVCLIKNLNNSLINGSIGVIKSFSKENHPVVYFPVPNCLVTITPQEWVIESPKSEPNDITVMAKRIQIPLILSWALSIHKSQGQTLNYIIVDLTKIFECGQAYVALSRAANMEGLQVKGFNKQKIKANSKVLTFSKLFN